MTWRIALVVSALIWRIAPLSARSQEVSEQITVAISPRAEAGPTGLALLTPAAAGTNVQVVVLGAAAGTVAVMHRGSCASVDPSPAALLGDVGAAGQIVTIVPIPFVEFARGGYVVALHAGLADFSTPLACGEIAANHAPEPPSVPEPTVAIPPASTATAGDRRSYTSPTYGYSLSWDASWSVQATSSQDRTDFLELTNGVSIVRVAGAGGYSGDALACAGALLAEIDPARGYSEIAVIPDLAGRTTPTGDAARASVALTFTFTPPGGSPSAIGLFIECRRLSAEAVLRIHHYAPAAAFAAEAAPRDALLASLTTPTAPPPPTIVVPPTPVVVEPPAATLVPTVDAACAGVAEWVAAITAVAADVGAILAPVYEANRIGNFDGARVALANAGPAMQSVLARFRQISPPPVAIELHNAVGAVLQAIAGGFVEWNEGLLTSNSTLFFSGQTKVEEALKQWSPLGAQLTELATRCGVPLPTPTPRV